MLLLMACCPFRKRITKFGKKGWLQSNAIVGELGPMMKCLCRQNTVTAGHFAEVSGPMLMLCACTFQILLLMTESAHNYRRAAANCKLLGLKYFMVEVHNNLMDVDAVGIVFIGS